MKTTKLSQVLTFCASVAFGCGAAIAAASVAAVSHSAPSLRTSSTTVATPVEVVRLEPITVTVSKATFDAIRQEETAFARAEAAKKVARG